MKNKILDQTSPDLYFFRLEDLEAILHWNKGAVEL